MEGRCDTRSDIYSLGIVLYEMLTGYTPFDADTPLAILMKHLHDPLPLPSKLDPDLPPSLEQVVLKALSKSPADRFQSAKEMTSALRELDLSGDARQSVIPPEGYAPQVVYSGDSRQQIVDRPLVREDTDLDIQPAGVANSLQGQAATRLNRLIESPPSVLNAILSGLGLFLIFNMGAAMVSTLTQQNVYNIGWAFEIYLAAGFFTLLAWSLKSPWLLTPAIILFGNAVILSYSALTGRWQDWAFLWMFEPLIVAAAVLVPMRLKKFAERGAYWTPAGSLLLTVLAVLLAISTCWLAFLINLFR